MRSTHVIVGTLTLCALVTGSGPASAADRLAIDEDLPQAAAPIDFGLGPGVLPSRWRQALRGLKTVLAGPKAPVGRPDAHLKGAFGSPIPWPIVGIHGVLLPDGRVLSFGTDRRGKPSGKMVHDIWDPARGTGMDAHLVLPNTTATDIFCSNQTLLATSGEVVITGGSLAYGGKAYHSNDRLSVFRPAANAMVAGTPMAHRRWYPSTVALPSGEVLVLGGREDYDDPATTPEILSRSGAWRALTGAASDAAFGAGSGAWNYPRAFVAPSGDVVVLGYDGTMHAVSAAGLGTIVKLPGRIPRSQASLPALAFAPGKVLSIREGRKAVVIGLDQPTPTITPTASLSRLRYLANATVLADGKVAVSGGSKVYNQLIDVANAVEIWDPATGGWSTGAVAQKPRLYHSSALLLPDATLLTMGGGAPGPVLNLNAEIYHPPYLFKRDGLGALAPRPSIVTAPGTLPLAQAFTLRVGAGQEIGRVTLVRTGSTTHGLNLDQRFLELPFTQSGEEVVATAPADARTAIPGYYLLFVFDRAGVPSIAKIVLVPAPA